MMINHLNNYYIIMLLMLKFIIISVTLEKKCHIFIYFGLHFLKLLQSFKIVE